MNHPFLNALDPNAAAFFDPLGDAPSPAPMPEYEKERARLRTALVTTRQSLAQARRALRMVLADPEVAKWGTARQPPWWGAGWAVLQNRAEAQEDPV